MKILAKLRKLSGVLLFAGTFAATAQAGEHATIEHGGRITALDFDNGTMIVAGRQYWTAPELQVEINGSYGAFTMLRKGMYIKMLAWVKPGPQFEVYQIEEVLHQAEMEES